MVKIGEVPAAADCSALRTDQCFAVDFTKQCLDSVNIWFVPATGVDCRLGAVAA
jgi:hypothetical protein